MKHTHKRESYNCADGWGKYLYQIWKDVKMAGELPPKSRWRTIALAVKISPRNIFSLGGVVK